MRKLFLTAVMLSFAIGSFAQAEGKKALMIDFRTTNPKSQASGIPVKIQTTTGGVTKAVNLPPKAMNVVRKNMIAGSRFSR